MSPTDHVRVVLWDADGVLQHPRRGWYERLTDIGGSAFATTLFEQEKPALRGVEPFAAGIARVLDEHPVGLSVEQVLALWEDIDVDADAFALIDDVRRHGTRCVLATNQQDHRARFMRDRLGYDRRFDATYYSSELGAMKPEPAYFERVLAQEQIEPESALFIDDNEANIAAATRLGIAVALHDPASGVVGLRSVLEHAGVPC